MNKHFLASFRILDRVNAQFSRAVSVVAPTFTAADRAWFRSSIGGK